MIEDSKKKLAKVIKDNTKWPLIIEGAFMEDFSGVIAIPAKINAENLAVIPSENGFIYPNWVQELENKSKKTKRVIICIKDLETIKPENQEIFCGLIKNMGINGYKFPNNAQLIIPVKKGSLKNLSKKITSLCLIYKVD